MLLWALLASLAASLAAIIGSTSILLLGRHAERAAVWLLAFAVGTLTGASTLHLIPEALERDTPERVMTLFLAGTIAFIVVERLIRWRHTHLHGDEHHDESRVTARILLWGDALHNFLDGIVLGVAFSASRELGMIAAIAVFAHEVPQEIGDSAILLSSGMAKRRALLLNYLSAVTVVPGTAIAFLFSSAIEGIAAYLLPVAAGGFLYIALADLVPTLHHHRGRWTAAIQIALILAGAAVIWATGEAFRHA
jgi:zinc and cadmium transporter